MHGQAALRSRNLWSQNVELLCLLVSKDLRVRYKSSFLGYLWALANPLAFTIVYYIVFQLILRVQMPHFGVYLVTGIFPWTWMANALWQSSGAYRGNSSLIRKVNLSRPVLPLSSAVQEMVHFCFAIPVLIVAVVWSGGRFHLSWLVLIPLMILVELAVIYPVGMILAVANVFVRDVEYLIGIVLQLLFFLTPIVFPESGIPDRYRPFFEWNPFFHMIRAWREVFYSGRLDLDAVSLCLVFASSTGVLAWFVHRKLNARVGELL